MPNTVNEKNIPAALKERRQWVLWRTVGCNGKATKVPYQVAGHEAKSNDDATWTTFDAVWAQYLRGGYDGIGYVFSKDDQFVGIDLDGCRYPISGEISAWAQQVIDRCGSYAEISPSESGVKIIAVGKSPFDGGKRKSLPKFDGRGGKKAGIEVYDRKRFFTITGQRLEYSPEDTTSFDPSWLQATYWPELVKPASSSSPPTLGAPPVVPVSRPSDTDLDRRIRAYLAVADPAEQGKGGHNTLLRVAKAIVQGFDVSEDQAFRLLAEEYNPRCVPPWNLGDPGDQKDFRRKVAEAHKLTCDKPRGWLLNGSPDDAAAVADGYRHRDSLLAGTAQKQAAAGAVAKPALEKPALEIVNAADYLRFPPPPVESVFQGLIDRGDKVFLNAQSKGGKSFFLLQEALCLAAGRPFLNWPVSPPQRVLILQFEIKSVNYHRRVRYVSKALGITAEDIGDRLEIVNLRGKPFLLNSLGSLPLPAYSLVGFDTLYKVLAHENADENSAVDMSRVLAMVDQIAECGPAVCIVHHGTKGRIGDRQVIDRLSGSGVMARDFDGLFTLAPHRDHPNEWLVLDVILRNYHSPEAQTLEFRDGIFTVRKDVPPEVQTSQSAARTKRTGPTVDDMLANVKEWVIEPVRTTDIEDRIRNEFSVGRDRAKDVIRQLEREGFRREKSKEFQSCSMIFPPEKPEVPPTQSTLPGL